MLRIKETPYVSISMTKQRPGARRKRKWLLPKICGVGGPWEADIPKTWLECLEWLQWATVLGTHERPLPLVSDRRSLESQGQSRVEPFPRSTFAGSGMLLSCAQHAAPGFICALGKHSRPGGKAPLGGGHGTLQQVRLKGHSLSSWNAD